MILKFDSKAVKAAIQNGISKGKTPKLMLVKDSGVYLMTDAQRTEEEVKNETGIVFAKGFNPSVDDFDKWYEKARSGLGGDDFAETLPWDRKGAEVYLNHLEKFKWLKLSVTKTSITMTFSN